ncbi:MAG TPA: chromate efflux transporter [Vicinamibacterales bacterium]|nr:chromate efflux transporter [Vicinamibacterales bacterium]
MTPLVELARLFAKLGTIAFGGPAAHIGLMRDEVVRRRQWLSDQQFLDLLGATHLIPGPNSTELAIHIGYARAGMRGLLVCGLCFIVPATAIVLAFAWGYVRFGALPEVQGLLYGVKPVIIAIVIQALVGLGRVAVRSGLLALLASASAIAVVGGVNELVVLAAAAAAGALSTVVSRARRIPAIVLGAVAGTACAASIYARVLAGAAIAAASASISLGTLFGVFLKAGAVLFGSGYVLLAFLEADLVGRLGWLTQDELLNAIAVGQITPGPVFTTATFIGYVLAGWRGAAIATAGIFLPAFVYVAVTAPIVPRLRRSRLAARMLDGVNAASLALMLVVTVQLTRTALVDPLTVALAAASAGLLLTTRVNSAWLVLGGAAIGIAAGYLRASP